MKRRVPVLVLVALALLAGLLWILRGAESAPPRVLDPPKEETVVDDSALRVPVEATEKEAEREEVSGAEEPPPPPDAEIALTGIVLDEARAPVTGARVLLEELLGDGLPIPTSEERATVELSLQTTTGADGRFTFAAPFSRSLQLRASATGLGDETARPVYAGGHYEIVLRRGAAVEGRVTEAGTGLPVADVVLRGWRQSDRMPLVEGRSGEDGRFRFTDLPFGMLVLRVTPPEHEAPPWLEIPLRPGETARADVELDVGDTVFGTVTDARSGQPVAGAEVGAGWTFQKSVRTDAAGNYSMRGAPGPGVTDMQARAAGYARAIVPVEAGARERRIDFALEPSGSMRGRVVDRSGAPLARVFVAARGWMQRQGPIRHTDWQSTRTGDDGMFRLTDLIPGVHYVLLLRKAGYTGKAFETPAPIAPDREEDVGDLPLERPGALVGRVVDRSGLGIPDVFLTLIGSNADRGMLLDDEERARAAALGGRRESHTDRVGGFAFSDLPEGTYSLVARVRSGPRGFRGDIAVRDGQTAQLEMEIDLGLRLAGRVVSDDGSPIPTGNVVVQLERDGELVRFLQVDHEGRFSAIGLEEDDYDLTVDVSRWANDDVPPWLGSERKGIAAGTEDIELVLRRAAIVEGRVIDARGDAQPGLSVFALVGGTDEEVSRTRTDAEGSFRLRSLPGQVLDLRYGTAPESEYPTLVNAPAADTAKVFRGVRAGAKDMILEY